MTVEAIYFHRVSNVVLEFQSLFLFMYDSLFAACYRVEPPHGLAAKITASGNSLRTRGRLTAGTIKISVLKG